MNRGSIVDTIMFTIESIVKFLVVLLLFPLFFSPFKDYLNSMEFSIKDTINYSIKTFFLKGVHAFAIAHDGLNRVVVFKYSLFIIFSFIFAKLYMLNVILPNDCKPMHDTIRNGFFIAPLVTLMFTHQARIIELFLNVFQIKPVCETCIKEMGNGVSSTRDLNTVVLDNYSIKIQHALFTISRNSPHLREKEEAIWGIFNNTKIYANNNRDNYERENTQALLIAATILFIGYMYFILGMVQVATTLLIFSFTILLNRLALGIRTIIKFYLIGELAIMLAGSTESRTKNIMTSAIDKAVG